MKSFIEFKQQREFGAILTDTFAYFRMEFKPLFKSILKIAGPYIAFFLVTLIFYVYTVGEIFFSFDLGKGFNSQSFMLSRLANFLYMIGAILAYTVTTSTVLHYIKSYINNNGKTDILEIKQNVKQSFWKFLGLILLKGLTLIIATMLCCVPIFYFIVPMAMVLPILVFRQMNTGDSYSYGFTLIKDEFWITLATLIVLMIIVILASFVFAIPMAIYMWIKMGVFSGAIDPADMTSFVDPIYIFLSVLSSLFQYCLNILITIGTAFLYFNLNERKNLTGTIARIKAIGNTEE
ncbi:hypothetical protein [Mangrovimonas sp. TPBH4]|uniref:hypothetical protein n=1 Tax=Mangrovimonas sp. TPBH4 TaxID=1645914 RepID=UPI0006B4A5AD|nr:hypothetical protein [Mangrovimonas sp. TPBH4]